jgi:hydroxymethylpyrimidine pyrophosphatase-like HAD family hydrolase
MYRIDSIGSSSIINLKTKPLTTTIHKEKITITYQDLEEIKSLLPKILKEYDVNSPNFKYIFWKDYQKQTKPFTLIDIEGVYYFITPQGIFYWGWSNTSPNKTTQETETKALRKLFNLHTNKEIEELVREECEVNKALKDLKTSSPLQEVDPQTARKIIQAYRNRAKGTMFEPFVDHSRYGNYLLVDPVNEEVYYITEEEYRLSKLPHYEDGIYVTDPTNRFGVRVKSSIARKIIDAYRRRGKGTMNEPFVDYTRYGNYYRIDPIKGEVWQLTEEEYDKSTLPKYRDGVRTSSPLVERIIKLIEKNKFDEAQVEIEKILKIDKGNVEAMALLSVVLKAKDIEFRREWKRLFNLPPELPSISIDMFNERVKKAYEYFQKFISEMKVRMQIESEFESSLDIFISPIKKIWLNESVEVYISITKRDLELLAKKIWIGFPQEINIILYDKFIERLIDLGKVWFSLMEEVLNEIDLFCLSQLHALREGYLTPKEREEYYLRKQYESKDYNSLIIWSFRNLINDYAYYTRYKNEIWIVNLIDSIFEGLLFDKDTIQKVKESVLEIDKEFQKRSKGSTSSSIKKVEEKWKEVKSIFENAWSLFADSKFPQAYKEFCKFLSSYYSFIKEEKAFYRKNQKELDALREEAEKYIGDFIKGGFKEKIFIATVNPQTGEILPEVVEHREAHREGIWHANAQVLIINEKGEVLIQIRQDQLKRKKDLSATAHLLRGESYKEAALRIIKTEAGLFNPKESSLILLKGIIGERKIGKNERDFKEKPYYDDFGVFYSPSKEIINKEFNRFYLYLLNSKEIEEIESNKKEEAKFLSLEELTKDIENNYKNYGSTLLQLFMHPLNREIVKREIHERITHILKEIIITPQKIKEHNLDSLKELGKRIILSREDWRQDLELSIELLIEDYSTEVIGRKKNDALKELENLYLKARILTTWEELKSICKEEFAGVGIIHKLFEISRRYGEEAISKESVALLVSLLKKGAELKYNEDTEEYVFMFDNKKLEGIKISRKGFLQIDTWVKEGLKEIRKGVIVSDMDKTIAERDKHIDLEILNYVNHLLLYGMNFAIISGNEFAKQFRRSLTEYIPDESLKTLFIYATGAGVKAIFDEKQGVYIEDTKYAKGFTQEQIELVVEGILEKVRIIWEKIIEGIRENRDLLEQNLSLLKEKIEEKLNEVERVNKELKEEYEVDVVGFLKERLEEILKDFKSIVSDKENKHKKKVEKQLDPSIEKSHLEKEKLWPFIDKRFSINKDKLIQATLKPIYPSDRSLPKKVSAREFLYKIIFQLVEKANAKIKPSLSNYSPLVVKSGGTTSIDVVREDVNKATAVEDLIKMLGFKENERELVLAIDDEMAPEKVGFPFLTVEGITVISVEKIENKREYEDEYRKKIKAWWIWSKEVGIGVELEATRWIYKRLNELFVDEVFKLLRKEKYTPVIKKLKEEIILEAYDNFCEFLYEWEVFVREKKEDYIDKIINDRRGGYDWLEKSKKSDILEIVNKMWHEEEEGKQPDDYFKCARRKRCGNFIVQFNPKRAKKRAPDTPIVSVKPEEGGFKFTRVAKKRARLSETRLQMLMGIPVDIINQAKPFTRGRILLLPYMWQERRQFLDIDAVKVALYLSKKMPYQDHLKIGFNGWGAYGSVNHLHLQAIFYEDVPEEERGIFGKPSKMPIETFETEIIQNLGDDITLSVLKEYPVRTLVVEGKDIKNLSCLTMKIVELLQCRNIAHNLIFTKTEEERLRVYIIPRKFQAPEPSNFGMGIAFFELGGEVIALLNDEKHKEEELENIKKELEDLEKKAKEKRGDKREIESINKEIRNREEIKAIMLQIIPFEDVEEKHIKEELEKVSLSKEDFENVVREVKKEINDLVASSPMKSRIGRLTKEEYKKSALSKYICGLRVKNSTSSCIKEEIKKWVEETLKNNPDKKQKLKKKVRVGNIWLEVREGGSVTIDITKASVLRGEKYEVPTKKEAMEDFIKSYGYSPEDGVYFGNETSSRESRDGIVAKIKGLTVYAVDKDQKLVIPEAIPIGAGIEATYRKLKEIADNPQDIKFIGMDMDGTILGVKPDKTPETLDDRKNMLETLIELIQKGIHLAVFADNASKVVIERVLEPLIREIKNRSIKVEDDFMSLYACGMVVKIKVKRDGRMEYEKEYSQNGERTEILSSYNQGKNRKNNSGLSNKEANYPFKNRYSKFSKSFFNRTSKLPKSFFNRTSKFPQSFFNRGFELTQSLFKFCFQLRYSGFKSVFCHLQSPVFGFLFNFIEEFKKSLYSFIRKFLPQNRRNIHYRHRHFNYTIGISILSRKEKTKKKPPPPSISFILLLQIPLNTLNTKP